MTERASLNIAQLRINKLTTGLVTVEACKDALTDNQDLRSGVDWLTEVIHRFTDAYMKDSAPSTVNMDVLMHVEKVISNLYSDLTHR